MSKKVVESLQIQSVGEIFSAFQTALEGLLAKAKLHITNQTRMDLKTSFYEAVANAIEHAKEIEKQQKVEAEFFVDDKFIGFAVYDHGPGFVIESVPIPDFNDYQSSGRGVFMMKQLGDELVYTQQKNQNTLVFKRYLVGQNATMREIDFLYQISEAVLDGESLDSIYQMILDQALEIFHVDRASIMVYDSKIQAMKITASRGIPENTRDQVIVKNGEGVSGYVFQHGRPLLIEDIDTNKRGIEKKEHYKSKSFMSVPLIYSPTRESEKIIGVINLTDRQDGKQFTKKDLQVLSTIANQAMASLYIRDLLDRVRQSEVMKSQLSIVRSIQESYLPKSELKLENFDIEGVCEMADSLGGDYYDYHLTNDWLYLVVADVSGHDIRSAMSMFNFRSQLRSLIPLEKTASELLTLLNQSLYDDLQKSSHFVSALIMRIHLKTCEWDLSSAGHYPPLFLPERFQFIDNGLILGIEPNEAYKSNVGTLEKGDQILFYTDGVIEALNQKSEFFGLQRLKDLFSSSENLSSAELAQTIVKQVITYRDASKPLDDLTALAVRFK